MSIAIQEISNKVKDIFKRYGVRRAAVFGSVARGDENPRDVDILVEMPRPYGLFTFLSLKRELEETLGSKVDLVEYSLIKPAIKDRVLSDAVQIV